MKIQVSGYENNRPVLTTYCVLEEVLAEAISSPKEGWFDVTTQLDTTKLYALVDQKGEYYGMIMFLSSPDKAMIITFLKREWSSAEKFQVRGIQELDKQLNY